MKFKEHVRLFHETVLNTVCLDGHGKEVDLDLSIRNLRKYILKAKNDGHNVFIIGNGGSASIASHAVVDFVNAVKVRALSLQNQSVLTCLSNDYGYDDVYATQLEIFFNEHDLLIAISSSGNSDNIVNAAKIAKDKGGTVVTLSGFSANNPLRLIGDLNYWINCNDYGGVEVAHQLLMHYFTDMCCYADAY